MVRSAAEGRCVLGSATPSIEALYACAKDPRRRRRGAVRARERQALRPRWRSWTWRRSSMPGRAPCSRGASCVRSARSLAAGRKAVLLRRPARVRRSSCCAGTAGSCRSARRAPPRSPTTSGAPLWRATTAATASPRLSVCPECGSPYLKKFGAGTQRVEAERARFWTACRAWARTCPSCAWTPTPPRARARTSACWSSSRQPTPPCCWARR